MGTFQATIYWPVDVNESSPATTTVHVLEKLKQAAICTTTQWRLGMVHDGYPRAKVSVLRSHLLLAKKKTDLSGLMDEYPHVFDGICRVMSGPPCPFSLKEGATPIKMHGSRPVSEPLKKPSREELAEQRALGIIRKIPPDTTTPWIHGVVLVPKKKGGVRFCLDYRPLNQWLFGAKFDNPTPFQAVRTIPRGMHFF